jgi:rhodanese-related sulfurtransferase
MKEISVDELKNKIDNKEECQLIDVREFAEYQMGNNGGEHIPLSMVPDHIDKISKDKPVYIICRSGRRSANAVMYLEQKYGYQNVFNVEGGMLAWKEEIDASVDVE